MSAAQEIRQRYAEIISQAERQAVADAGRICSICSGEHRTCDCTLGKIYIHQCRNTLISPPPHKMLPVRQELVEAIALIYEALGE